MAGTVFGRLSLEEGDSANSLEGLDIKLGGEGKNTCPCLLGVCKHAEWFIIQMSSLAVFCHRLGKILATRPEV